MNIPQTPLDIKSGIFVVPATGTWRVNYSLYSLYGFNNVNIVNLYHQGVQVREIEYYARTTATDTALIENGGREAFFTAKKEETFHLFANLIQGKNILYDIMICFEYLN